MLRLSAFCAALVMTVAAAWVALFGGDWISSTFVAPYLDGDRPHSPHNYAAWVSIGSGLFASGMAVLSAIRRRRDAQVEDERLTPLPPASRRPL